MCLAVPGRVVRLAPKPDAAGQVMGTIDLQGSHIEVNLALVPEATVGSWVLVHAGFAINHLDEAEARETWQYLHDAELIGDLPAELRKGKDVSQR